MSLEVVTVANGDDSYPGNFTPFENKLIMRNTIKKGLRTLNLFSGISTIGHVRIDYSCQQATLNMDVFEYLEGKACMDYFDAVIIDAPYNQRFADKYQKTGNTSKQFIIFANVKDTNRLFNLIKNIINPDIIILKSWNYYIPQGYLLKKGYLCYAGGYRKPTLLLILQKKATLKTYIAEGE